MPPLGTRSKPGPRFSTPDLKVRDHRDGLTDDAALVAGLRQAATKGRLSLDGLEHQSVPSALGEVCYACDGEGLTAFGGVPLLAQFAYRMGLADICRIPMRKSQSTYSPGKLSEVVTMVLVSGLERVSHVDDYSYDPGLCAALGLERLPDQGILSRFLSAANEASVQHLRSANQQWARAATALKQQSSRLVIDSDTRDVRVYRNREGTVRNARNDNDPYFTFEVTTLRNSHDILDGGLLRGATHPVPLFQQRFQTVLEQVSSKTSELIWCADAAWYAGGVFQQIEAADADPQVPCDCKYAIRAQSSDALSRAVAALGDEHWSPCGEGVEIAEFRFALTRSRAGHDPALRRHIVTRMLKRDRKQQDTLVDVPAYEYGVIVTNLDWRPRRVWALYNGRATVESILREGSLGFRMNSLPSAQFRGNQLFCQLLILAYNLVNAFRRLCLPKEHCRHHVQSLRRMLLTIPATVRRSDSGLTVHCAPRGPHTQLLATATSRIQELLSLLAPQPG